MARARRGANKQQAQQQDAKSPLNDSEAGSETGSVTKGANSPVKPASNTKTPTEQEEEEPQEDNLERTESQKQVRFNTEIAEVEKLDNQVFFEKVKAKAAAARGSEVPLQPCLVGADTPKGRKVSATAATAGGSSNSKQDSGIQSPAKSPAAYSKDSSKTPTKSAPGQVWPPRCLNYLGAVNCASTSRDSSETSKLTGNRRAKETELRTRPAAVKVLGCCSLLWGAAPSA